MGASFRAVCPARPVTLRVRVCPKLLITAARHLLLWRALKQIGVIVVTHKGVEYTVAPSAEPGFWKWQFRIGDKLKSGRTRTRIGLLASRRVQLRIDRELKEAAKQQSLLGA
jgi:hypothetical protein